VTGEVIRRVSFVRRGEFAMNLKRVWSVLVVAACAFGGASSDVRAVVAVGHLAGQTQISYGCPGPAQLGQECERWFTFPQARFSVAATAATAAAGSGAGRVVVSDRDGRFSVELAAGTYTLTPLAQAHTRGGKRLLIRVLAGRTAWALVRFEGVPRMV